MAESLDSESSARDERKSGHAMRVAISIGIVTPVLLYGCLLVFNPMNSPTAARNEHTKGAMRSIRMALASYYQAHSAIPPGRPFYGPLPNEYQSYIIPEHRNTFVEWIDPNNQDESDGPLSDRFLIIGDKGSTWARGSRLYYHTDGKTYWMIIGNGPDGDRDTTAALAKLYAAGDEDTLVELIYDPTNGEISGGDLIGFDPIERYFPELDEPSPSLAAEPAEHRTGEETE